MKKLRILSISTLFPSKARPAFGGFVARQMLALAARGDVEVTMIKPIGLPHWPLSLREPYASLRDCPEQTDFNGIEVHHPRFRLIPRIGGDTNPGRIANAVLPVARKLHAEQPFDLVDAEFFFPDGPAAAAVARALGLPLTIKARGSDIHYWGQRPRARAQILAAAAQARLVFGVSRALCNDMAALGIDPAKLRVHYTGLDRERFHPFERKAARALVSAVPELGVWAAGPLIVTPGALIPLKGQRLVIEALAQLPGVHLALAGTGPDEEALRQHAANAGVADRVQFLGQVSHDLLPKLLSAADAMVLPSEREGMANVWIEALACGTPLVITDVGGARELLSGPSAGRIVARTPDAIATAVRELLAAPTPQDEVAANAASFSWEASAAELVGHWRSIIEG